MAGDPGRLITHVLQGAIASWDGAGLLSGQANSSEELVPDVLQASSPLCTS